MRSKSSFNRTNTQNASVLDRVTLSKLEYQNVEPNPICTFAPDIRSLLVCWNTKPDPFVKL